MTTPDAAAEYWDITDEAGRPTGEVYRRGDAGWPAGRFHLVVAVCPAARDGSLLMTQRAAAKDFPLAWELPGGSALAGEASPEAAARELREETGLKIRTQDLGRVGRFVQTSALLDLHVVQASTEAVLDPDPAEVPDAAWMQPGAVEQRLMSGQMAAPWTARLEALWTDVLSATSSIATQEHNRA